MSLDNILVTTPYVTHPKVQLVLDELEKEWKEHEEDPGFIFTIIKLNNENFTPGESVNLPGTYASVLASTKPIILKDYKVNGESAPTIFSVAETTTYIESGQTKNAVKLQSSFGMFYIYENDDVVWITRYVKASDYIDHIEVKHNVPRDPTGTVLSVVETKFVWKGDIPAALKLLFTDLTISIIYKDGNELEGVYKQYSITSHTITTDGIYVHTFDEPATGWTDVTKFHLYAGMLSTI